MVWQEVVLAIGTTKSKKLVHLFNEKRLTDCPLAKMPPVVSGKDLSLTEEERALLKGNRAFMCFNQKRAPLYEVTIAPDTGHFTAQILS